MVHHLANACYGLVALVETQDMFFKGEKLDLCCLSHRGNGKLNLQRGMGSLCRFNICVLSYLPTSMVTKSTDTSCSRSVVPVQSPTFCFAMAPLKFTCVTREVKLVLQNRGIHIHYDPDHHRKFAWSSRGN